MNYHPHHDGAGYNGSKDPAPGVGSVLGPF
jgi:hypothetical protein